MNSAVEQKIENALIGLSKLLKAVCYYPDGHPSLNNAVTEAVRLFADVTTPTNEPLVLGVSRQEFFANDLALRTTNPLPKALAQRLFYHKIKMLTVFPDLKDRHLLDFSRLVSSEPATIVAQGGINAMMDHQTISTISVNELNLAAATARKNSLEQGGTSTSTSSFAADNNGAGDGFRAQSHTASIQKILQQLDIILHKPAAEHEQAFLKLLSQLTGTLRQTMHTPAHAQVLLTFQQIDLWLQNSSLDQRFVAVLKQAIRSMGDNSTIDLLIDDATTTKKLVTARHIISEFNDDICPILIERLSTELNHKLRKFISQLLIDRGEKAYVPLIKSLKDERWFVVRNAIAILGESRDESLIPNFVTKLHHQDARVVNEAIRALARIRSTESSQALLNFLGDGEGEFSLQIILALGALGDPVAVPPLIRIATRSDPMLHNKALIKAAIGSLGEIGDPAAVVPLMRILKRIKILKRAEYNEIRCQAATSLANFSDSASLKALQQASKSRQRTLATAARQAQRLRGEADYDE